jgi:hypothetical protein
MDGAGQHRSRFSLAMKAACSILLVIVFIHHSNQAPQIGGRMDVTFTQSQGAEALTKNWCMLIFDEILNDVGNQTSLVIIQLAAEVMSQRKR